MSRKSLPEGHATCLHCDSACRLTDGKEAYLHRPDLHENPIFVFDCPEQATLNEVPW